MYSVVVSTWCASLMCETSAMTVEPSAPKGEIECKCVCVCVRENVFLLYMHEWVYVTVQCMYEYVCALLTTCLNQQVAAFLCMWDIKKFPS